MRNTPGGYAKRSTESGRTFSASSGSHELQSGFREGCVKQNWRDGLLSRTPLSERESYL